MAEWLTEKQVSEIFSIPLPTLRNWRHERQGPPYSKLGRAVRYRYEDVVRFMEERAVAVEPSQELEKEKAVV